MEIMCTEEKWKLTSSRKGSRRSGGGGGGGGGGGAGAARSFSRRCTRLVKEQRARFYIMRRCVTMLVCWRDV